MAPLRVLIVGGGIAGNALAFWLSRLNHTVTVVERFPSLRATGLQLDLRGHGVTVLRRMGLEAAYRERLAPEQGVQVVDASGRQVAYFPIKIKKSPNETQGFTTEWEIMRGDFCQLLYESNKENVKYIFGTSIDQFEENARGVHVQFANGTSDAFDLVVGADGVGSRTRRMLFGTEGTDSFHPLNDTYIAYFTIPKPVAEGEKYIATMYMGTKGRGVMTRRQKPDRLQVYIGGQLQSDRLKKAPRGDVKEEKEALGEIMRGAGWQIDDIVNNFDAADDFYLERLGLVKLNRWSRGRVVLLGDAAYCPSVMTGMGTTSSLIGAYVLAGEIVEQNPQPGDDNALRKALEGYEKTYRPFMAEVIEGVLEKGGGSLPSSKFAISVMNVILRVVSVLKINLERWFFQEKVYRWKLPEYPALSTVVKPTGEQGT